jgi:acetyltransferase-like isoleucine patch superfamily enzyme
MLRAILLKPFCGQFGLKSYIGKPIFLSNLKNIFIGCKVRIYPMSRIETLANGKITIEDNVSIGQSLHIISGTNVVIGKNTTLSANVFISDVEHQYTAINIHIMEQPLDYQETLIGKNCFIGYGAVLRAGTVLGEQCIVGANAVVKGSFPNHCVLAGNPAKIIKQFNEENGLWEKVN